MQTKICSEMKVENTIDSSEQITKRVEFIKNQLLSSGMKSLVLGISGGQDSTLCGKLCQLAVSQLGGDYKFIAVRLPYGVQADENDCSLALKFINPSETITYNIKQVVDTHVSKLDSLGLELTDFQKGNIKARERMVTQYAIASAKAGLVVGTDHSSEAITGFYTKFGDGAADLAPLFGLNKRQGKQLLKELNCPQQLYLKIPTADLEDNKPGISDEIALGVSYEQIDNYLEGKDIESYAKEIIESHYQKTEHKRKPVKTLYN